MNETAYRARFESLRSALIERAAEHERTAAEYEARTGRNAPSLEDDVANRRQAARYRTRAAELRQLVSRGDA